MAAMTPHKRKFQLTSNTASLEGACLSQTFLLILIVALASCESATQSGAETRKDSGASDTVAAAASLCSATKAAPAPVVFRFTNTTAAPLFYYLGCFGADYSVSSEVSGFTDEFAPRIGCSCSCGDPPICSTCGACYDNGNLLKQDAEVMWYPQESVAQTCSGQACTAYRSLPLGRYRFRMRLYGSEANAVAHSPVAITVVKDFEYSAPGKIIVIDI